VLLTGEGIDRPYGRIANDPEQTFRQCVHCNRLQPQLACRRRSPAIEVPVPPLPPHVSEPVGLAEMVHEGEGLLNNGIPGGIRQVRYV